jgi:hypothetical protein
MKKKIEEYRIQLEKEKRERVRQQEQEERQRAIAVLAHILTQDNNVAREMYEAKKEEE